MASHPCCYAADAVEEKCKHRVKQAVPASWWPILGAEKEGPAAADPHDTAYAICTPAKSRLTWHAPSLYENPGNMASRWDPSN